MKISKLFAVAALCLTSFVANAATILEPTDNDVNFFMFDMGYTIGIFDQADTSFSNSLIVDMDPMRFFPRLLTGSVGFYQDSVSGNYFADNGVATLSLGATSQFMIAVSQDGASGWNGDIWDLPLPRGGGAVLMLFDGPTGLAVVDVKVSAVPIPAAVWLFGTGLIGIVAVARRRV